MNKCLDFINLLDSKTTTGTGTEYKIPNGAEIINVVFSIAAETTFTAKFEAKINSGKDVWKQIGATNLSTSVIGATTSSATDVYQILLAGIDEIRINLTSVSGTVSCYGKIVG